MSDKRPSRDKASSSDSTAGTDRSTQSTLNNSGLYSALFEHALDAFLIADDNGRYIEVNPAALALTGYSREELLSMTLTDITPGGNEELGKEMWQHFLDTGSMSGEYSILTKDGNQVEVEFKAKAHILPGMHLSILRDISARKQASAELRCSEERYDRLFQDSVLGIFRSTPAGKILDVNPAYARMFGYSSPQDVIEAVKNVALDIYVDPDKREEIVNLILRSESPVRMENHYRRKDGSHFMGNLHAWKVQDKEGNFQYLEGFVEDISDRKTAEEELLRAYERISFHMRNSPLGFLEFDHNFILTAWSKTSESIFGWSAEEIVGKRWTDISFVLEEDLDTVHETIGRLMCGEERSHVCYNRNYSKDGRILHCEWYNSVLMDSEGNPVSIMSQVRDITAQVLAEEKLSKSEALLNETQELARLGGWELDLTTKKQQWTRETKCIHEVDEDYDPNLDKGLSFFPDESRPIIEAAVLKTMTEGEPYMLDLPFVTAKGNKLMVRCRGRAGYEGDKIVKLSGTIQDISQEYALKEERKMIEERYRRLFEHAHDGIFVHSVREDGTPDRFVDVNPAACRYLGYEKEELLQMSPKDIDAPEAVDIKMIKGTVLDILDDGSRLFEMIHVTKDNRRIPVELHSTLLQGGDSPLIMTVARNIEERKQLERHLLQAKEKAEAANKSKSEFLANMSHEVRTPLNGVLGMLNLLQYTEPTDEQKDYIQTAVESGKGLLTVINDILDISTIEAGKFVLQETPFSLSAVMNSVENTFRQQAVAKGIALEFSVSPKIPKMLLGDGGRIRQILFNLVGNAVKFTDAGHVRIAADVKERHANSASVEFSVQDTGIGIPEDKLDYIFESFTQVDSGYTRKYQGTGLGLGIVKRLVEIMEGELGIQSKETEGTIVTFCLRFSLFDESVAAHESQVQSIHKPKEGPQSILLAEDNLINRTTTEMMLRKLGYSVVGVENGRSALEAAAARKFDLILMDIQMPVMNGIEATRTIRGADDFATPPDVPILALTAYAMKGDKETFLKAGLNGYLSKPFDMNDLKMLIEEYLRA